MAYQAPRFLLPELIPCGQDKPTATSEHRAAPDSGPRGPQSRQFVAATASQQPEVVMQVPGQGTAVCTPNRPTVCAMGFRCKSRKKKMMRQLTKEEVALDEIKAGVYSNLRVLQREDLSRPRMMTEF
ncbi:hypothetical protein NDU88_002658 [Pleurodeles waltl]|uniref:Uncharacterized protein n=1 Tax=Pleurodeles waltl TaxID=8319 RepID=A0AAV7MR72_PLEWA|nr:hypothetical protein NDU88_002658 [Pleurodeles waltl]